MIATEQTVMEGHKATRDLAEKADVVIIGSGCGGATAAVELSAAGFSVVMVERGGYFTAAAGDLDQLTDNMLARIDGGRGLDTSTNGELMLTYGNCVGGASVHYWADSWRLPKDRAELYARMGVEGHEHERLEPIFARLEKELNVHVAGPEYYNRMNQLFDAGARRLGWHSEGVPQARRGCVKSGHCMQGCAYDAKQSQLVTHVPAALKKGVRLYSDCRVQKIVTEPGTGRASGIVAEFMDQASGRPNGHRLTVEARAVVLAAGGYGSAAVWLRSGLPNGSGQVGKNLCVNPCPHLYALFDEEIRMWENIPSATGTLDFRLARFENERYVEGGYLLHPNQLQAELLAITLPGFGEQHWNLMEHLPRIGSAIAWIDDENGGTISLDGEGRPVYDYKLRGVDVLKARDAMKKEAMLLFAAGAREVIVPDIIGTRLRGPEEIALLDTIPIEEGEISFPAPHPAGALRMGKDPEKSVVGASHEAHEVPGLFVADPSVFPLPPSVDPSLSIMAFAVVASEAIREKLA
jgi:choline dehydrogenase-like flavoprotein